MSDVIFVDSKPRKDFSTAAFHREGVALQYRYAAHLAGVPKHTLKAALATVPDFLYCSDLPLTDQYVPRAIVYIKTPRGKIAIIFPECTDDSCSDNTLTDRSVTIHFIGDVTVADMEIVCANVLEALEPFTPAQREMQFEPCGFARV